LGRVRLDDRGDLAGHVGGPNPTGSAPISTAAEQPNPSAVRSRSTASSGPRVNTVAVPRLRGDPDGQLGRRSSVRADREPDVPGVEGLVVGGQQHLARDVRAPA
jgi:hypothetical protein